MLKRMILAKKTLSLMTAKLTIKKHLLSITVKGIKSCDFNFCEYFCETQKNMNTKNISVERKSIGNRGWEN